MPPILHTTRYGVSQVIVEQPDPEMTLLYFLRNKRILTQGRVCYALFVCAMPLHTH